MSNLKWFRYTWVWEKSTPTGYLDANRRPLKAHEDIVIFSRKRPPYFPRMTPAKRKITKRGSNPEHYHKHTRQTTDNKGLAYPRSVLKFKTVSQHHRLHQTQKPVPLLEYLIETYTQPGQVILDNVMGSGSVGIACLHTKRQFIGIDDDPEIFQIAAGRIEKEQRRMRGDSIKVDSYVSGLPLFETGDAS